jgi:hypothetical protein
MGVAASLFYSSNDPEKQTLLRRCTPSAEQLEEQQDRWNALAEHLLDDLKVRSGYSLRTWLQGSYKFGTQIRPVRKDDEFDIDLGVYFQWAGKPEDRRHGAQTLKCFVQDSLSAYEKRDVEDVIEVCPPKTRCCRIRYRNSFHIDVPAYHLDVGRDARTLATTTTWEKSDPKAIYVWFRDLFDELTREKVRRHIRYLKTWAALKFKEDDGRPTSILLTVLVAEAAAALGDQKIGADDEAFGLLVDEIIERLDTSLEVRNPVAKNEDLNRLSREQSAALLDSLTTLQDVAKRANSAESDLEAADIWQESFEHMFPMPDIAETLTKSVQNHSVAVVMPDVIVTAEARAHKDVPRFTGINKIGPIPKNCAITFEVANASAMPAGSQILWIVRNEGREAELINDLGHSGQIETTAEERSAYKGTHYMDCIVKLGGRTVAMRRIPVTITGLEMPRRNPASRPAWVRLR